MTVPVITERTPAVDQSNEGYVAVREFTIIATSEENAKALLLSNKSITLGTVYQSPYSETPDADAIALNISVRGSPPAPSSGGGATGLYIVTVRYGRPALNGQTVQPELAGPAVWRKQRTLVQETADIDLDGKPLTNTVDEPFDPPAVVQVPSVTAIGVFLREHASWSAADLYYGEYFGKVNDLPFLGAAAGGLLCTFIEPVEIQPGLFRVEIQLQYRPPVVQFGTTYEGWATLIVNRGRRIWVRSLPDGTKIYAPLEDSGVAVTEPKMIDAMGTGVVPVGDDPHLNQFRFYDRIDFNLLGIV